MSIQEVLTSILRKNLVHDDLDFNIYIIFVTRPVTLEWLFNARHKILIFQIFVSTYYKRYKDQISLFPAFVVKLVTGFTRTWPPTHIQFLSFFFSKNIAGQAFHPSSAIGKIRLQNINFPRQMSELRSFQASFGTEISYFQFCLYCSKTFSCFLPKKGIILLLWQHERMRGLFWNWFIIDSIYIMYDRYPRRGPILLLTISKRGCFLPRCETSGFRHGTYLENFGSSLSSRGSTQLRAVSVSENHQNFKSELNSCQSMLSRVRLWMFGW